MTKVKDAIKMLQDYLDPNEEICIAWWSKDLFENRTHSDEDSKIKEDTWINVVNKFDDMTAHQQAEIYDQIITIIDKNQGWVNDREKEII